MNTLIATTLEVIVPPITGTKQVEQRVRIPAATMVVHLGTATSDDDSTGHTYVAVCEKACQGVERVHAELCRLDDGTWLLGDLGTQLGTTFLGERIVAEVPLMFGEDAARSIRLGRRLIHVRLVDAPQ